MSTGADCRFYEKEPREWFYDLQRWPYGDWPEYDTYGPFETYDQAHKHLGRNHANPGGHCTYPLPGCEHDLAEPVKYRDPDGYTHKCLRCGAWFSKEAET